MTVHEIREKYLSFFSKNEHTIIPSAPLTPENDPTTLFTGSGMQPLITYLLGEKHPEGTRLTDSQKCFRAEDIEDVGDNRHTTFFEMLGNWSLGDYFKKEQLTWFFEFLTQEVGLDPKRLYVTVFSGDEKNNIPKDEESVALWKDIFAKEGIEAKDVELLTEKRGGELGMQGGRIFYYDASKNWWSRAGAPENMPAGEPGGPDSEVFYDYGEHIHDPAFGEQCHPNCDCGRFVEIGNSVFMEYLKNEDDSFSKLDQQNVDFGGGLERIAAASIDSQDVFQIDALKVVTDKIEELSGTSYTDKELIESYRVVADHLRGAVFMIGDDVLPSNTDAGYFVRRLIRRAVRHMDLIGMEERSLHTIVSAVTDNYKVHYPKLEEKQKEIEQVIQDEEEKFRATLQNGLKVLDRLISRSEVSAEDLFNLFQTHGLPVEVTLEELERKGFPIDRDGMIKAFKEEMKKHQELSRTASAGKFKGGLANSGEKTAMLHTCTHLLLTSLRKFVGDHVHQAGSNITEERTRFDFTHSGKVDRETLDKVEEYVNGIIEKKCDVVIEKMRKEEAKAAGIEGSFWEKYPDVVNVYMIKCDDGTVYSQELCGGPHVNNTGNIKGRFKIKKEEGSSAGIRRVKAVLEE